MNNETVLLGGTSDTTYKTIYKVIGKTLVMKLPSLSDK